MIRHRSTALLAAFVTCMGLTVTTRHNLRLEPAIAYSLTETLAPASAATEQPTLNLSSTGVIAQAETSEPDASTPPKPNEEESNRGWGTLPWLLLGITLLVFGLGGRFIDTFLLKWFSNPKITVEPETPQVTPLAAEDDLTPTQSTTKNVPPPIEALEQGNYTIESKPVTEPDDLINNNSATNGAKPKTEPIDHAHTSNDNNYSALAVPMPSDSITDSNVEPPDDDVPISQTTRLSRTKKNSINKVINDLRNPDPKKQRKAIWELAQRGDSRAIKPLVDLMVDSDSKQRSLILEALSQIGTKTLKPMQIALALSMQDENPEVRKNAIRDLTRVYELMTQINQILSYATNDTDSEVQETARWAMNQLNNIRPPESLENFLSSDDTFNGSGN